MLNNPYDFDLPTHRLVNGKQVLLTEKEQQEVLDEWTSNRDVQLAEIAKPRQPTLEERVAVLEGEVKV